MFALRLAIGVRSSWLASATSWRWASTERSSKSSVWLKLRAKRPSSSSRSASMRWDGSGASASSSVRRVKLPIGASAVRATTAASRAPSAPPAAPTISRTSRTRSSWRSTSSSGRASWIAPPPDAARVSTRRCVPATSVSASDSLGPSPRAISRALAHPHPGDRVGPSQEGGRPPRVPRAPRALAASRPPRHGAASALPRRSPPRRSPPRGPPPGQRPPRSARAGSRLPQGVAHAANRVDQRTGSRILELAAEVPDVHAQRVRGGPEVVPPDALVDDGVREHPPGVRDQQLEQLVLRTRQLHERLPHAYPVPVAVEAELLEREVA